MRGRRRTVTFRGLILRPDGSESHETARSRAARRGRALGIDAGSELKGRAAPDFFATGVRPCAFS